jgi:hypothetical protein
MKTILSEKTIENEIKVHELQTILKNYLKHLLMKLFVQNWYGILKII